MAISTQVGSFPSSILAGRMPPSYATSGSRMITPGNLNRTFAYGQQGEIEMKPMEDVVRSALAPGEKQTQSTQDIFSTDPMDLIQQQHEQGLQQIETSLEQTREALTRETKYKLAELETERGLKEQQLRQKFASQPLKENETWTDREREFQTALQDINNGTELAKLRISSKIQPDLDVLEIQGQQATQEQLQAHRDKLLQIQQIDALGKDGTIKNPLVVQQKKLKIAGIDLSLSELQEPEATPYQTATMLRQIMGEVDRVLRDIEQNPFAIDPTTGEMTNRDEEKVQLQSFRADLQKEMTENVLPQIYPQYSELYRRYGRLTGAAKYARGEEIVPATGEPVGTLGTKIAKMQGKTPNRAKPTVDPLGIR